MKNTERILHGERKKANENNEVKKGKGNKIKKKSKDGGKKRKLVTEEGKKTEWK